MGSKGKSKYTGKFSNGHAFGQWTVVDGIIHGSPAKMDVRCVCGKIYRRDVHKMVSGQSTSCGCTPRVGENAPNWRGISGIPKTVLYRNARSALSAGTVSEVEAANIFTAQNGSCSVTGQFITPENAKLVKINTNESYTPNNVTWVHTAVSSTVSTYGVTGSYAISNMISTSPTMQNQTISSNIFEQMGFKPMEK